MLDVNWDIKVNPKDVIDCVFIRYRELDIK